MPPLIFAFGTYNFFLYRYMLLGNIEINLVLRMFFRNFGRILSFSLYKGSLGN